MAKIPVRPLEEDDCGHAFADTTDRFQRDWWLRSWGFRIIARPKNGPTLWEKRSSETGKWEEWTEFEAVKWCEERTVESGK